MIEFFKRLYKYNQETFLTELYNALEERKKMMVVTANPETMMIGVQDQEFKELLMDNVTTIVADGIGVVKAANYININIPERIPGVLLAEKLLEYGNDLKRSIYLLGAKEEVILEMKQLILSNYPHLTYLGGMNGYVKDKDEAFNEIAKSKPDIVLVALGIPSQEKLIFKHINQFDHGIFVGVGGSFDVISGLKKRAPSIFIKLNLEWLYRITKEPSRMKRFYHSNIKFMKEVRKLRRETNTHD